MNRPLRALLLSAGLGTRLRPITFTTPKCLVSVLGEPLLRRWLRQLESAGCEAVLINTHYLADQVTAFLKDWSSSNMRVATTYEPELLGTAGTLLANQDFFKNSTGLLIHADNAMDGNLEGLLSAHYLRPPHCLLTLLTFDTDDPASCGIVTTDYQGVLTSFHEKVSDPPGRVANGALYAFDSPLIEHLLKLEPRPTDFSIEVLPNLLGRVQTWHTTRPYLDIGTPSALLNAQSILTTFP